MKKRRTRKGSTSSRSADQPAEARAAEAVTVAWMLALVSTLAAEVVGIVFRLMLIRFPESAPLRVFSATLFTIALLTGLLTLVLTPIAIRLRRSAPPRGIVVTAVVVGVAPLILVLLSMGRG